MKGMLVLEDGNKFEGELINGDSFCGEVVFNTAMCGYQEILTDPTNYGQLMVMTYPMQGNYGVNNVFNQSSASMVNAVIVGELCDKPSNWQSEGTLLRYLEKNKITCLYNVDTRAVTRHIRKNGAMRGVLVSDCTSIAKVSEMLAAEVNNINAQSVTTPVVYRLPQEGFKVAVIDFGIKKSIMDALTGSGFDLTIFPADSDSAEIMADNPDGIFLSNGPGNPKLLEKSIDAVKELLNLKPLFGVGMGHQVLALALGGDTYKLKFGHHGVNQPVKDLLGNKVHITAQNHGYAVDENSLSKMDVTVTHRSLNDGTVEGLQHNSLPIFSVQYHPGISIKNDCLFKKFAGLIAKEEK